MASDVLEKLGLSPGEAKVYRALLLLGRSTVGPIGRESSVSHSKIYEILQKLISKGLASQVFYGKQRAYQAAPPTILNDLIEKKERELQIEKQEVARIIPQLLEKHSFETRMVELFEGFNGLKSIREELMSSMKSGEEMLVLGAPRLANELWERWLLDFHARREKRGVGVRIIYNYGNQDYGEKRKRFKRTKLRYLPRDFATPTWFDIFNDKVLIVVVPAGEKPYAMLVRSASVADSVRNYFNLLWNISVE